MKTAELRAELARLEPEGAALQKAMDAAREAHEHAAALLWTYIRKTDALRHELLGAEAVERHLKVYGLTATQAGQVRDGASLETVQAEAKARREF